MHEIFFLMNSTPNSRTPDRPTAARHDAIRTKWLDHDFSRILTHIILANLPAPDIRVSQSGHFSNSGTHTSPVPVKHCSP